MPLYSHMDERIRYPALLSANRKEGENASSAASPGMASRTHASDQDVSRAQAASRIHVVDRARNLLAGRWQKPQLPFGWPR